MTDSLILVFAAHILNTDRFLRLRPVWARVLTGETKTSQLFALELSWKHVDLGIAGLLILGEHGKLYMLV